MRVLGIDEVGRGSLAGPLVVGAVVLDRSIKGLKDSKLLSRSQRERLVVTIKQRAKYIGLGWVSVQELDNIGLTKALGLAAERALTGLNIEVDRAVIDGSFNYCSFVPRLESVIKADLTVPAVSAASVMAKVSRDQYMISLAAAYPDYLFEKHVGYGTSEHIRLIKQLGATQHHRRSFEPVKSLFFRTDRNIAADSDGRDVSIETAM